MSVDHGAWDALLAKYLQASPDGISRFAYGAVTASDKRALKDYLARLQATEASPLGDDENCAFWINLYNALTVDAVLDRYPLRSLRDVPDIWSEVVATVEGRPLSLNDIEHDILRKRWRDPRIHYAVNCASASCPNLMPRAFTAASLEAMLTQGARDYINHPRAVEIADGKARLSQIFRWYAGDFGANEHDVIAHLQHYASPDLKARLAEVARVDGYIYDWSLNEAKVSDGD